ncbi:cytochrome oxidase (cbb3-type) [Rhodopirellula islandica]|uniref:Cytochrome oxidase (Cbb3-type) n=1 Tax=Rhodopirellula islandica TaxID=595434 RepID=A0A0J1BAB4_RHOIS|nr:c-type cytochrome [Rhodopirellula islandica]KLU03647.1 cytochrome oxidase (cbb3-type) [Rhodopirellula islandica]
MNHLAGRRWRCVFMVLALCCASISNAEEIVPADMHPFVIGVERLGRFGEIDPVSNSRLLVTELSCTACHRSDRTDLSPKGGPKLSAAGSRLSMSWVKEFLQSPHQTKPGTTMPDVLAALNEPEREEAIKALVAFIGSLQEPFPLLKAGGANPLEDEFWNKGDAVRGGKLYHEVGCVACHETDPEHQVNSAPISAVDRLLDELDPEELEDMGLAAAARKVPSVPHAELAKKYSRQSLTHFLHDPEHVRPSGRMPSLKLTPNEAADIAEYLFEKEGADGDSAQPEIVSPGPSHEPLVARGKQWFVQLECANCHDTGSAEESKFATDWDQLSFDSAEACWKSERQSSVRFHLDDFQKATLAKGILNASFANDETANDPQQLIQQSFLELNCYACHERDELGGVGRYRKAHFESTGLADLGDEGRLPPALTGVGAKLHSAWMRKVLEGHPSTRLRPHMTIRMPRFPKSRVDPLVKALETADQGSPLSDADVFPDHLPLAETGMRLTQVGCIQCHVFDGQALAGVVGIDLGSVTNRIRPSWFREFLLDPGGRKRGTRMPSFFPDGKSQSPDVLDGDAEKQIAALWSYLKHSDRVGVPPKIAEALAANYELKPNEKPLLLRTFMQGVGTHAIAVGFPEGVHFAFDAETPRLALAWKEDFVDARSTWFERFSPPIDPLGKDSIAIASEMEFRLSHEREPMDSETPPLQFLGFRFDAKRVPTFRYRLGDAVILDRCEATREGALRRTIELEENGSENMGRLQFRALKDTSIQAVDSQTIQGSSGLKVSWSMYRSESQRVTRVESNDEVWLDLNPNQTLEVVYQW